MKEFLKVWNGYNSQEKRHLLFASAIGGLGFYFFLVVFFAVL